MQSKPVPTTDADWTAHSLTIQGVLFELKCQEEIEKVPGWKLISTSYPVEFPVTRDASAVNRSKASNLDIWIEYVPEFGIYRSIVLVECKKCNPEFVDWVFFPKLSKYASPPKPRVHIVENTHNSLFTVHSLIYNKLILTDTAYETRGDYLNYKKGDKTKTSTTAITEAAYQITLATQFMLDQERHIKRTDNELLPMRQIFWPMIVTTANLYTCEFQVEHVNLKSGEIPFDKVKLTPQPYLLYNYAVPYALQYSPEAMSKPLTRDTLEEQARMPILVVQSESLPAILAKLQTINAHDRQIEWL